MRRVRYAAGLAASVVAIRHYGLPELRQLAATGPAADRAAREAFVQAYEKVVTDYQGAAQAAARGDMTAFRADFGLVAPHGLSHRPGRESAEPRFRPVPVQGLRHGRRHLMPVTGIPNAASRISGRGHAGRADFDTARRPELGGARKVRCSGLGIGW